MFNLLIKKIKLTFALGCIIGALISTGDLEGAIFNDGGTHFLNDNSLQNDPSIIVSDNTTLVVQSGAVLGGATQGSGTISVLDTSTLLVEDGLFGGSATQSGRILLNDDASATIADGLFGASGTGSGSIRLDGNAGLRVLGGTFGASGIGSGVINAHNDLSGYNPVGTKKITIDGGSFGGSGIASGQIVTLQSELTITGGVFLINIILDGYSNAIISGGVFGMNGASNPNAPIILVKFRSTLKIEDGIFYQPIQLTNSFPSIIGTMPRQIVIQGGEFYADVLLDGSTPSRDTLGNVTFVGTEINSVNITTDDATSVIGDANFQSCLGQPVTVHFEVKKNASTLSASDYIFSALCSDDEDNDGVSNEFDQCLVSDLQPTVNVVLVGGIQQSLCDSKVDNRIDGAVVGAEGCSPADYIQSVFFDAKDRSSVKSDYIKTMNLSIDALIEEGRFPNQKSVMKCAAEQANILIWK